MATAIEAVNDSSLGCISNIGTVMLSDLKRLRPDRWLNDIVRCVSEYCLIMAVVGFLFNVVLPSDSS